MRKSYLENSQLKWSKSRKTNDRKSLSKSRTCYYPHSVGILWLCTGNDRLDELPVRGLRAGLRRLLRGGPRIHSVDDHCRAVLPGTATQCHGDCRSRQLDGQLCGWNRIPQSQGDKKSMSIFNGLFLTPSLSCRPNWRTTPSCHLAYF